MVPVSELVISVRILVSTIFCLGWYRPTDRSSASESSSLPYLVLGGSGLGISHRRLAKDGEDVGETAVGDPDFASVENVVSSGFVEFSASADGRSVGAASGLRQGEGGELTT